MIPCKYRAEGITGNRKKRKEINSKEKKRDDMIRS